MVGSLRIVRNAAVAGLLSLACAALAIRLEPTSLRLPWGVGDSAFYYMLASTLLRFGWVSHNPDVGFPFGMDLGHFPMPEFRSWGVLKAISWVVDDPFTAVNLLFLAGFFFVGACSYLLFHATVRLPWLAMILAVTAATLPWHFLRFQHVLLSDYSPVPIALLLTFLMWSGWWTNSPLRVSLAVLGSVYVGSGGLYFAFFAMLGLAPVLMWRIVTLRRLRTWWPDLLVTLTVPITLGVCVVAFTATARGPSTGDTFIRSADESLSYAGDFPSLISPWPWWPAEALEGSANSSLIAVIAAFAALALLIVLPFPTRAPSPGRVALVGELTPWFRLLVWFSIWFAAGPGWVFSSLVTPVIRAWGRLSLEIVFVVLVIAGIALRRWLRERPKAALWVAALLGITLVWQVGQDHRPFLLAGMEDLNSSANAYTSELRGVLPAGCPILQLPLMRNPEDWSLTELGMGAYDHWWIALYAPEYEWSFGVVSGTEEGLAANSRYFDVAWDELQVNAREDGFCAVHADAVGLGDAELKVLETALGPAIASEGRWSLYGLAGAADPGSSNQ